MWSSAFNSLSWENRAVSSTHTLLPVRIDTSLQRVFGGEVAFGFPRVASQSAIMNFTHDTYVLFSALYGLFVDINIYITYLK